jgi:hypothetical protein
MATVGVLMFKTKAEGRKQKVEGRRSKDFSPLLPFSFSPLLSFSPVELKETLCAAQ